MPRKIISDFRGRYRFLSNFAHARVTLNKVEYWTVEHAYQAAKVPPEDFVNRDRVWRAETPWKAKAVGKTLPIRKGWDDMKLGIMRALLLQKFQTGYLRRWLIETGDAELIEGNHWGDTYWGVCNGEGENHLGRLLMELREILARSDAPNG